MRILILIVMLVTAALPAAAQSWNRFIARGDSALAAMDINAAMKLYRRAEQQAPGQVDVLWRLSKVHTDAAAEEQDDARATRLLKRALDYARRAEAAEPSSAMAQVAYAIAYGQMTVVAPYDEKLELSKKLHSHALRALELEPDNHVAMLVLGIWNREIASINWAMKLFLEAVYDGLPDASLEESYRLLSTAVRQMPRKIMPHVELAKTLIAMDEEGKAGKHLRRALELPATDFGDSRRLDEARTLLQEL